jgi:hypothetical protein
MSKKLPQDLTTLSAFELVEGFKRRRIQTVSEYLGEDSFRLVGCMV